MRWRQVAILTRMLLRLTRRRALRIGSPGMRGFVLVAVATFSAVFARLTTFVFADTGGSESWNPMLDTPTIFVILGVLTAFLLVKIVFLDTAGLLDLTVHLPLTNKERAAALLANEAVTVAVLTLPMNGAFALAVTTGPGSDAGTALVVVVVPALLTYLVATIVFELLGHVASGIGLARIRDHAATLGLGALVYTYMATTGLSLQTMDEAAVDGTDPFVWQAGLAWSSRQVGLALPLLGSLLAVVVLTVLALRCVPSRRPPAGRYLPMLRTAARRGWVGPYDLASLRSTETVAAVCVFSLVFVVLWTTGAASPLFSLAALALPSLHHWPAVQHLQDNGPRTSAAPTLGRMLRAPTLLLGAFALLTVPFVVLTGATGAEVLVPLGVAVSSVVVTLCLGIAFPAQNGIPFAAVLSTLMVGGALGLVGAGTSLLGLPAVASVAVIGTLLLALTAFAVRRIKVQDARSRHQTIVQRPVPFHGPATPSTTPHRRTGRAAILRTDAPDRVTRDSSSTSAAELQRSLSLQRVTERARIDSARPASEATRHRRGEFEHSRSRLVDLENRPDLAR